MEWLSSLAESLPAPVRVLGYVGIGVATHFLVLLLKRLVGRFVHDTDNRKNRKLRSIASVLTSAVVFTLYFLVLGLVVEEVFPNFEWTTYFASASVIAL